MRWETEERELKEQLASLQEQARKQVQTVTTQLQNKSAQLEEREREMGQTQQSLETQLQQVTSRLSEREGEWGRTEQKLKEVSCFIVVTCLTIAVHFELLLLLNVVQLNLC